jgi:hypothetical protein
MTTVLWALGAVAAVSGVEVIALRLLIARGKRRQP